jgi:hypothetical protein
MPEDKNRDGISLVPLLEGKSTPWPDRYIVTHVGRWPKGTPPIKERATSVRWREWNLVYRKDSWKLYNLKSDPGEMNNVIEENPQIAARLNAHFDAWWQGITPFLVNEDAYKTAPTVNPFKAEYARQMAEAQQ